MLFCVAMSNEKDPCSQLLHLFRSRVHSDAHPRVCAVLANLSKPHTQVLFNTRPPRVVEPKHNITWPTRGLPSADHHSEPCPVFIFVDMGVAFARLQNMEWFW